MTKSSEKTVRDTPQEHTHASPAHAAHTPTLLDLTKQLESEEESIRQGGPATGHARQAKLNRLTARQRLAHLFDANAHPLELGLWSAWDMYPQAASTPDAGPNAVPAAGVIVQIGPVHGRPVMAIANDATVKAGAFFPATCKKVLRAQKIAMRCNLPLVYLVDSAGVYLPMQDEIFPDEDDFGRIFRNNAVLSAAGVPQFAAVMGNCVAGGAYLPVLSDKLVITADSQLYLAGPALVKAAIGQTVDAADLGGAKMHATISGTADFLEPNDTAALHRLRALIDTLPASAPGGAAGKPPARDPRTVYDIVSADGRHEYDARDLLAAIVDKDSMQEYKADFGKTLLCTYATIAGHKIAVVASQRLHAKTPAGEMQIGGVIYGDAADKAARFVMDASQSGLPLVFFQDVQGFMVGRDSEQAGIIRRGAKLVNAVSNATVPKITVIVGGSFGAGNYALCGKAFDPVFIFAWPAAKYAVMGAAQATHTLEQLGHRAPHGDDVASDYAKQTDIRYGAARGWVDAIIAPDKTREVLATTLALATRPPPPGGFRAGVFQV
jgi:acetyl-CoA carboxylase carboxyltransferase component